MVAVSNLLELRANVFLEGSIADAFEFGSTSGGEPRIAAQGGESVQRTVTGGVTALWKLRDRNRARFAYSARLRYIDACRCSSSGPRLPCAASLGLRFEGMAFTLSRVCQSQLYPGVPLFGDTS
jgi:hypothetical protein